MKKFAEGLAAIVTDAECCTEVTRLILGGDGIQMRLFLWERVLALKVDGVVKEFAKLT